MKLTEQDIKMFEMLHSGKLGNQLLDYIERLTSEMCDVRKVLPGDEDAARKAGEILESGLIERIKLAGKTKGEINKNMYV